MKTLDEAHLLLAPSVTSQDGDQEGIPIVLMEAMAMGLPIVCSDVGGQAELITSECGILIKKGSSEVKHYVESLSKLLNDSDLRQKMGNAARNRVCQLFRIEDLGDKMLALIDKAIQLRNDNPRSKIDLSLAQALCIEMLEQNRLSSEVNYYMSEFQRVVEERELVQGQMRLQSSLFSHRP